MPFIWSLGYPDLFARGTLFDRYPFLLPNIVCAMILVVGILVGILFLEETHHEKRSRRDVGLEVGQKILSFLDWQRPSESSGKVNDANFEESHSLMEDEPPPGYRTTEGSPQYPCSRSLSPAAPPYTRSDVGHRLPRRGAPLGVQRAFTRPVIIHIIGYGVLA
ncbi:MAG: hypothetical protein Q9179_000763 [Wetmoreana sp. 5 TL-2023]